MDKTDHFHRHSIRLKGYDYSQPGAYFVTVVTYHRDCIFGDVNNCEMVPNQVGKLVAYAWNDLVHHYPFIRLDAFVIMPNHVHGILWIEEQQPVSNPSLGVIVGTFKSDATRRVRKITPVKSLWQRNYYEHIVRNERELEAIRRYITGNPVLWSKDEQNPHIGTNRNTGPVL